MPGPPLLWYTIFSIYFVFIYTTTTNPPQFGLQIIYLATGSEVVNDQRVWRLIAFISLAFVCLLVYFAPKGSRTLNLLFAALKVCVLIALFVAAAYQAAQNNVFGDPRPGNPADWEWGGATTKSGTAVLQVLFAFQGWENATLVSGEIKNHKTLKWGFISAVMIVGILYSSIAIAYACAVPWNDNGGLDIEYAPTSLTLKFNKLMLSTDTRGALQRGKGGSRCLGNNHCSISDRKHAFSYLYLRESKALLGRISFLGHPFGADQNQQDPIIYIINSGVLQAFLAEVLRRELLDDFCDNPAKDVQALKKVISNSIQESNFHLNHLSLIRARLEGIAATLRDCINARVARHSALEASHIRKVSRQSLIEAQAVRMIAIVTLVFLPGTFTAAFFGMQYVRADLSSGTLVASASPELLLYFAITLPLMAATLLAWWFWDRWQAHRRSSQKEGSV
ncbi:amino acid permease-domain-containing protein [Whalleya microplaca]|nr:amino acid permease-domain-containing protein [Whalleya microplaca]